MHYWGDGDFDWGGLNECTYWFPKQLHRYARFNLTSCKEKYGTMRLEFVGMCHRGLYGLIFPGRLQWQPKCPTIRRKGSKIGNVQLDDYDADLCYIINDYLELISRKIGLSYLFWQYQKFVFNMATLRAFFKWPHLIKEITNDYEFQTWLYNWVKFKIGFKDRWTSAT